MQLDEYGALGLAFKAATTLGASYARVERYARLWTSVAEYELRPATGGTAGRPLTPEMLATVPSEQLTQLAEAIELSDIVWANQIVDDIERSQPDLAAVLTYQRNAWGNAAGIIQPAAVQAAR